MLSTNNAIPSFVAVTPFGIYCNLCNQSLPIARGLRTHSDIHSGTGAINNTQAVRAIKERQGELRCAFSNDYTTFFINSTSSSKRWFCGECYRTWKSKQGWQRHQRDGKRGPTQANGCNTGRELCLETFATKCGNYGPKSFPTTSLVVVGRESFADSISQVTMESTTTDVESTLPPLLMISDKASEDILAPFVREDESAEALATIYKPLLDNNFEATMKELVELSSENGGGQETMPPVLRKWLEVGAEWLQNYAASHILQLPANSRFTLARFEQREYADPDSGELSGRADGFTLRRGISRLTGELKAMLRFLFYYRTSIFDYYKQTKIGETSVDELIRLAVVPKILKTAMEEKTDCVTSLPVVCVYACSRGFRLDSNGLGMYECGWHASRISSILHLLRAGVCGYLCTEQGAMWESKCTATTMEISRGCVTNRLSPWIRHLRSHHDSKAVAVINTVNANNDITVRVHVFQRRIYSRLIEICLRKAKAAFGQIFVGDDWEVVFEPSKIFVGDWAGLVGAYCLPTNGKGGRQLSELCIVEQGADASISLVRAIMEFAFCALGYGSARHSEVERMLISHTSFHNNFVYYQTESWKQASSKTSFKKRKVQRRLSYSMSRCLLLHRVIATTRYPASNAPKQLLFPGTTDYSMTDLVRDMFELDFTPSAGDVRQFITSLVDVLDCSTDGTLVSNDQDSMKSCHSTATARKYYSTYSMDKEESGYDSYHKKLGEPILETPEAGVLPFSAEDLLLALDRLLGSSGKGEYRSEGQRQMVDWAANTDARHSIAGLPCGGGKSMSYLVPALAAVLGCRHRRKVRFVVLPYKFLLGHMVEDATSRLGEGVAEEVGVAAYTGTDIAGDKELPCALTTGNPPRLVFLTLDAAANLLRFYCVFVQGLHRVHGVQIILDEVQQLFGECNFRDKWVDIRLAASVGAPIMCLSGSLPDLLMPSVASFLRLMPTAAEVSKAQLSSRLNVVWTKNFVGENFSFNVVQTHEVVDAIVGFVKEVRGAVHVLCATRAMVERLKEHFGATCMTATSESSSEDQASVGKMWRLSHRDILVTTTVGLVGIENPKCQTIVVAGVLFNASSLVQAIGRLRPGQRGPDTSIRVFTTPIGDRHVEAALVESEKSWHEVRRQLELDNTVEAIFKDAFTTSGLLDVLKTTTECHLQLLCRKLGDGTCRPCGRCGVCSSDSESENNDGCLLSPCRPSPSPCPRIRSPRVALATESLGMLGVPVAAKPQGTIDQSSQEVPYTKAPVVNPYLKRLVTQASQTPEHSGLKIAATQRIHSRGAAGSDDVIDHVRLAAVAATSQKRANARHRSDAEILFRNLKYFCVVCRSATCAGQCQAGGCFACGSPKHGRKSCRFYEVLKRTGDPIKGKKVCYSCYQPLWMEPHDCRCGTNCPVQRRFQRVLFWYHSRHEKSQSWLDFFSSIYKDEEAFYSNASNIVRSLGMKNM